MNVVKTSIDGVVIIEPRLFEDSHGYYFESFSQREFDEQVQLSEYSSEFIRELSRMSRPD